MINTIRCFSLGFLGCLALSLPLRAQTLVVTPSGNGTAFTDTTYPGSLGLYFNVNQSISVTSVGYWDTGTNGVLNGSTISVAIFNVTSPGIVAGTRIDFTGTTGSLVGATFGGGQFRTSALGTPVTLSAGSTYAIITQGYGTNNAYINSNTPGTQDAAVMNTLSNAITLQGSYYDSSLTASLLLPTTQAGGVNNAQWLAGTFTATTAIPEPSTVALLAGLAVLAGAMALRRRRA